MTHNALGNEKSPYLLQHKNNPVWWQPWGPAAFESARAQNKPIFLSIGYSTCYWCHMMEKDSFEVAEVAEVLNKNFISIKVDREERPDVDQFYMDAVTGLTGRGGWPMSVFLTPEGKPFYGGTYFWKPQFIDLCTQISQSWADKRDEITSSAGQIIQFLRERADSVMPVSMDGAVLTAAVEALSAGFDETHGGFGGAPKFPPAMQVRFLLREGTDTKNQKLIEMASKTLESMARGGIYDHLDGGFSRYSTDNEWLVPHFEKMLYDNALLAVAYLESYQVTKKALFKEIAEGVLSYVQRRMEAPGGGFYSAEDAGEAGVEGEFYVWAEEEIEPLLTVDEYKEFCRVFGVTKRGNFENYMNVLHIPATVPWSDRELPLVREARMKLCKERETRDRPLRDEKIITSWNGLMMGAFAYGYRVLGDVSYLQSAEKCATFVKNTLVKEGVLYRRAVGNEAHHPATLEDYAYLIEGLIRLYEARGKPEWLMLALELQEKQDKEFWDSDGGGYFYSIQTDLSFKKKEYADNATPSSNGISVLNLFKLFGLTYNVAFRERAMTALKAMSGSIVRYPAGHGSALMGYQWLERGGSECALVGEGVEFQKMVRIVGEQFLPRVVVAAGKVGDLFPQLLMGKAMPHGATAATFICEKQTCGVAITRVEELGKRLTELTT